MQVLADHVKMYWLKKHAKETKKTIN